VIVFRSYRALQNEQKLSLPSMVGLHKGRRLRNKKKAYWDATFHGENDRGSTQKLLVASEGARIKGMMHMGVCFLWCT
jgi:hypothetical protein